MVILKMWIVAFSHDAQTSRDRALADGEDRSDQQSLGIGPNSFGKKRLKGYDQWQQLGRQCGYRKGSFWRRSFPQLTRLAVTISKTQMDKVQLRYLREP